MKTTVKLSSKFQALTLKTLLALLPMTLLTSDVLAMVQGPGTVRVEIEMPQEQAEALKSPEKSKVPTAKVKIFEEGVLVAESEISLQTRGQTSLRKFLRKNFAVKALKPNEKGKTKLKLGRISAKSLILTAGPEDVLGTKNLLGTLLLQAVQVPSLPSDSVEVVINGKSQGLYLVMPSPAEYALKKEDNDVLFRRRYDDDVDLKKANKELAQEDVQLYKQTLEGIHKNLTKLKGEALVSAISENLNLDHYMRWLAVNYLVQNGDYADEVFFSGKKTPQGKIYFDVLPWDMDDLFSEKMHQANLLTFANHGQEERSQKQMLYAFESRLDEAISRDPVLLQKYFETVSDVVTELQKDQKLAKVFARIQAQVGPYLTDADILENGKLDAGKKPHNANEFLQELMQKQAQLQNRLTTMQQELELIRQEGLGARVARVSRFKDFVTRLNQQLLRRVTKKSVATTPMSCNGLFGK